MCTKVLAVTCHDLKPVAAEVLKASLYIYICIWLSWQRRTESFVPSFGHLLGPKEKLAPCSPLFPKDLRLGANM